MGLRSRTWELIAAPALRPTGNDVGREKTSGLRRRIGTVAALYLQTTRILAGELIARP
jgi:hypothetical protein